MKQKTLTIVLGMIFLVGIMVAGFTSADRIIDDIDGIYIDNFVAGSTVQANFSYSYLRDRPENPDNSPLILRINITSSNEENFPVWRGDFEIDGYIQRANFLGFIVRSPISFNCSEYSTEIIHPIGQVNIEPQNGTFYCFDPQGELDFGNFNARDTVFLNIKSHPALWPGEYDLSAELYYLTDTYPPFVNITNKDDFEEKYYNHITNNIEIRANIIDANLESWWGIIFTPAQNITLNFEYEIGGIYHFTKTLPGNIQEGDYELKIFAKDTEGNIGNDSTTLKIDRTGPNVELVEPTGVVSEVFSIKFNVTDEKAGVDNESVKIRLREIVNSQICPETGGVVGEGNFSCITTPWINLTLIDGLFEVDINTTELNLTSGEYWLEAKAEDILGNKAEWIV